MDERTRKPDRRDDAPPGDGAPPAVRSRGRVRQALVCPYCRDEVPRSGALACARRGCGALYHRECWDECAASYGGCAVYGCGSKATREVSTAGYLVRLLKLALAALLFPPRLARRMVEAREPGAASPLARAHGAASTVLVSLDDTQNGLGKLALSVLAAAAAVPLLVVLEKRDWVGRYAEGWQMVLRLGVVFACALLGPYLLLLVPTLLYLVLRSELGALLRADVERATVLTRLREGQGKSGPGKKG